MSSLWKLQFVFCFSLLSFCHGIVAFVIARDCSNCSLSQFSASEWIKGKQLEEVVTIKNTWVLPYFSEFKLSPWIYYSILCLLCHCNYNYSCMISSVWCFHLSCVSIITFAVDNWGIFSHFTVSAIPFGGNRILSIGSPFHN